MKNHYLHIYIDDDGKITISSSDGVSNSIATVESKDNGYVVEIRTMMIGVKRTE